MTPDTRPPVVFSRARPGADGAEARGVARAAPAALRGLRPDARRATARQRRPLLPVSPAGSARPLGRLGPGREAHGRRRRPAARARGQGRRHSRPADPPPRPSSVPPRRHREPVHGLGVRRHLGRGRARPVGLLARSRRSARPRPHRRDPRPGQRRGPQRLALVCTNGKRDQCCALRGRPVAAAIAAATDWDTWECSHLGGHRFAATMMLLPTGDMFGWLDPESALEVMQTVRRGPGHAVPLPRAQRPVVPGAGRAARRGGPAGRLPPRRAPGVCTPSRPPRPAPAGRSISADETELWEIEVIHRTEHSPGIAYRVVMAGSRLAPTFLSCSDGTPKAEVQLRDALLLPNRIAVFL